MIKQFYEKALPSQGVYCVAGIKNKRTTQRFAETLDEVVKHVEDFKKQDVDVYVAMATFEGYSRKSEDAVFLRSFFIDLDVGEDKAATKKGYLTKEEAHDNLLTWLEEKELPPPIILDSGTGIHAYWAFEEDIAVTEWKLYAEKFKAFCLQDLHIDPAPTADVARIMRCPDTFNYKTQPPSKASIISDCEGVYSFEAFKEFLGVEEPTSEDILKHLPKGLDEDTKALLKLDNQETVFEKIAIRSLDGDGCEQIKWAIEHSKVLPEPVWTAVLSIAQHCTDRDEAIHKLSEDYEGYSFSETEKKANLRQGKPYSCETFNQVNPDVCDNCKFKGKYTNPLALGRVIKIAQASEENTVRAYEDSKDIPADVIPDHPRALFPYFRGEHGGIYYQPPPKINKKGEKEIQEAMLIYPHELFPVKRMYSPAFGDGMIIRQLLPKDNPREYVLWSRQMLSAEKFKEVMTSNMYVSPDALTHIMNYLIKWGNYLMSTVEAELVRTQMGWSEPEDKKRLGETFGVGNRIIKRDGSIIKAPASPTLRVISKMFEPKGTYEKWQASANALNEPSMEMHAFGVMLGFGSPAMCLTSTPGVSVSYSGEAGNGKTGAMYGNLSIWGNPEQMSVFESTGNALTTRYVTFKNIPFGVDEAHERDPKEVGRVVHSNAQGKAKIRMQGSINAEREIELTASTICMMTVNTSLLQIIATRKAYANGEMARLIEFNLTKPRMLIERPEEGVKIFDPFKFNYGHAGPELIKAFYKVGEEEMLNRVGAYTKRFRKDFGFNTAFRFYDNMIGATFGATQTAVEFGIVNYDLERIYDVVLEHMIRIGNEVITLGRMDYEALVGEFINKFYTGFLGIKEGKATLEPRTSLVGRLDVDTGNVCISTTEFKKYLSEKMINIREFEEELKKKKILIGTKKMRLDAGWKGAFSILDKNMNINAYVFATQIPDTLFNDGGEEPTDGGT
jgi:hypothetical protein